jgi:hypothetical protein
MGRKGRKNKTVVQNGNANTSYKPWSSGIKIAEAKIILMDNVEELIGAVQQANGTDEISMMFKGEFSEGGFCVYPEYYIPLQEKTKTSVDYWIGFNDEGERDAALKEYSAEGLNVSGFNKNGLFYIQENMYKLRTEQGYNVIVHSHPFSTNPSFSGADDEHVNRQFPCSLLSNDDGDICDATILFKLEDGETLMMLPINKDKIERWDTLGGLDVEGLEKIVDKATLRTVVITPAAKQSTFYGTGSNGNNKVGGNGSGNTSPRSLPMDSEEARISHHDWIDGYKTYKVYSYIQALKEYEMAASVKWISKMAWIERNFFAKNPEAISALNDEASLIYGMRKYGISELDSALPVYTKAVEENDILLMAWLEANFLDTTNASDTKTLIQGMDVK